MQSGSGAGGDGGMPAGAAAAVAAVHARAAWEARPAAEHRTRIAVLGDRRRAIVRRALEFRGRTACLPLACTARWQQATCGLSLSYTCCLSLSHTHSLSLSWFVSAFFIIFLVLLHFQNFSTFRAS